MRRIAIWGAVLLVGTAPTPDLDHPEWSAAAPAALSVKVGDKWVEWWRSDLAPTRWTGPDPRIMAGLRWQAQGGALEWGELQLSGVGEAWRLKAIVVRLDPGQFRFRLTTALSNRGTVPEWTVDSAGAGALLAVNAGQFAGAAPWGWVVHRGREIRPQGRGPLAVTILFDSSGGISFVENAAMAGLQAGDSIVEAFQSYPSLLVDDGGIPTAFGALHPLLDLDHRDSRLAMGQTRDGKLLLLLTRFDGLGGSLDGVPFGLTVPETAALMGALGCRTAVALDGGISGQLLVRTADTTAVWRGWRKVPLGLIAEPRP